MTLPAAEFLLGATSWLEQPLRLCDAYEVPHAPASIHRFSFSLNELNQVDHRGWRRSEAPCVSLLLNLPRVEREQGVHTCTLISIPERALPRGSRFELWRSRKIWTISFKKIQSANYETHGGHRTMFVRKCITFRFVLESKTFLFLLSLEARLSLILACQLPATHSPQSSEGPSIWRVHHPCVHPFQPFLDQFDVYCTLLFGRNLRAHATANVQAILDKL